MNSQNQTEQQINQAQINFIKNPKYGDVWGLLLAVETYEFDKINNIGKCFVDKGKLYRIQKIGTKYIYCYEFEVINQVRRNAYAYQAAKIYQKLKQTDKIVKMDIMTIKKNARLIFDFDEKINFMGFVHFDGDDFATYPKLYEDVEEFFDL